MKKFTVCLVLTCLVMVSLAPLHGYAEAVPGGWQWQEMEPCELPELIAKAFEENLDQLGVTYIPVLYTATQIVAGTNHLVLAFATPSTENPESWMASCTLYEDLDGKVTVTGIKEFKIEDLMAELVA